MTEHQDEVRETEQIRVIVCRPMEKAEVIEIGDDLRSMQETVGGMIEEYMPFYDEKDPRVEDVAIICDDEGKMKRRQMNRLAEPGQGIPDAIVRGTFHWRGILRRIAPQRCEKGCVALLKRYLHAHHFGAPLSAGRHQKGRSPIRREQNSWQANILSDSQSNDSRKTKNIL